MVRNNSGILGYKHPIYAASASFPTDGLLARYQFEDNNNDSYGSYNMSGGNAFVTGKVGKAANVQPGYPSLNDSALADNFLGQSPFSISFWARFDGGAGEGVCFCVHNGGWSSGMVQAYFYNGSYTMDFMGVTFNYGSSHNFGLWHHYVSMFSGTQSIAYLDGAHVSTQADTSNKGGVSIVSLGARPGIDGKYWSYDQYYLYKRVLTAGEISALYNGGAGI